MTDQGQPCGKQQKLQILVLHGSRQDGEVFSQRLKTLVKKLKNIADLHFVSAPHTLPLQHGQSVPMRAWWRHWNIGTEEPAGQQQLQTDGDASNTNSSSNACKAADAERQLDHEQLAPAASQEASATASPFAQRSAPASQQHQQPEEEELPAPLVQQLQHQPSLLHGQARQEEITSMMASGWEAVVLRDWSTSLQHLTDVWTSAVQDFDGVLGFSNGAAAAFLFAAHAAAHPGVFGSLRFVALAGGYVPEPLEKLLHPSLLAVNSTLAGSANSNACSSSSNSAQPVSRLKAPLPFPSLHMMGSNDPLIDLDVATQLMDCFQTHSRVQLVHDSGHCVPQQARYMQEVLKFIVRFADIPVVPQRPHQARKQHGPAATAAAAAGVESAVADIEAKLHRQGLREKVSKGPAKKHIMLHMDSSGQAHQHHDHLISPKASHHNRQREHQQEQASRHSASTHHHSSSTTTAQQQQPAAVLAAAGHAAADSLGGGSVGGDGGTITAAVAAGDFGEATDVQLEELEALEAIFGSEYSLISTCPPTCVVRLREPGAEATTPGEQAPPSALFALKFKLPKDYPTSSDAKLLIDIDGPLGAHDPAREALQSHLAAVAAEQQQELGGSGGYIWQLVGAAKEWIDANIPADIANRKAGQAAAAAAPTATHSGATQTTAGTVAAAGEAAAAGVGSSGGLCWWEKDEVDIQLVAKATAEAAAAHWASWSVNSEDDPWGADDDAAAAAGATAAGPNGGGSSSSSSAEALASAGDGVRGRWDYVIGLVGKPSAGKSTFWNAVCDPVNEEDAAREGAYPFTTITPNVGRGFIALPDPSPLLGFSPDQVQPAYGFAPGLDISRVQDAGCSNIGPLLQLVKDCGWQQQQQLPVECSGPCGDGVLWRRVPVVVKDVAGLVPGAYQGRGRGNAFLGDLCDADVLVHVVDASGTTDSKGVAMTAAAHEPEDQQSQQSGKVDAEGDNPIEEVSWVRRELHCWVFDNVRAKWPTVVRRPSRLPGLFSGYHAPIGLVHAVLRAVGVKLEDLAAESAALGNAGLQGGTKETAGQLGNSSLASWGEWELHRLVAHFLAARFPILLALNKADLPSAQHNIRSVLAAYPHHAAVAVSAAAERKLHQLRRQGLVQYEDAAGSVQLAPDAAIVGGSQAAATAAAGALQSIQQSVLGVYGTTGCLAALTCAVALKPPRWVFPIADRDRCVALAAAPSRAAGASSSSSRSRHGGSGASSLGWGMDAKARAAQGAEAGVLRDCVLMKPGSRVEDVFWVLKRPPYGLLEGDFVRAECRVLQQPATGAGQKMRVVRKDELVGPSNAVLLLQTNKKVSWQHTGKQ